MCTHVLGYAFHDESRVPVGWHHEQVMCLDDPPPPVGPGPARACAMDAAPGAGRGSSALTEARMRVQSAVGTNITGSQAKQSRKDSLAVLQVPGDRLQWSQRPCAKETVFSAVSTGHTTVPK